MDRITRTALTLSILTVAALLGAPAATAKVDPVTCTVGVPYHGCTVHVLSGNDATVACGVLTYGYGCGVGGDGVSCYQALWGVHTPDLIVGGFHSCNAMVWVNPGIVAFTNPCSAYVDATDGDPAGVTCTWSPVRGYDGVACAAYGRDPLRVACTLDGPCPGGDFHTDGWAGVYKQACTVGAYAFIVSGGPTPDPWPLLTPCLNTTPNDPLDPVHCLAS